MGISWRPHPLPLISGRALAALPLIADWWTAPSLSLSLLLSLLCPLLLIEKGHLLSVYLTASLEFGGVSVFLFCFIFWLILWEFTTNASDHEQLFVMVSTKSAKL